MIGKTISVAVALLVASHALAERMSSAQTAMTAMMA